MHSRRRRLTAAFAALAAMLFLQAAFAFMACDVPAGSPGMAAMQAGAMPDCDESHDAGNLCVAHCQSQDQAFSKVQAQLPLLALPASTIVMWQPPRTVYLPHSEVAPLAAAPPRILFQSFLL